MLAKKYVRTYPRNKKIEMLLKISEKNAVGAHAKFTHSVGIFVIAPAISRHRANRAKNRFEIRLTTFRDFFQRQRIDRIEGSYMYAARVGLGAKRADPACHVQYGFSGQRLRFQQEIPAIFLKGATKQNDAIK